MILNSTTFGVNRTKDVEVGPDRRRFLYTPQTMFAGGINMFPTIRNLQIRVHVYQPRYCCGD
jgi:hypothetical protein